MGRDRQRQIVGLDAGTIVAHADQARTAILDIDFNAPRPGVKAVLDEFLDHRCGALDDLASGDLVDEFSGE